MTHVDLINIATKWLKKSAGCAFTLSELKNFGTAEIPDVIGFRPGAGCQHGSVVVECKTSRADFLADAKKPFRVNPETGVGAYRFYMSPAGVILPEDLPERWGLIAVKNSKAAMVTGPEGNAWSHFGKEFHFADRNIAAEWGILASALRRQKG